jgi:two-component system response regulator LytT
MRIAIVEDETRIADRLERMIRAIAGAEAEIVHRASTLDDARRVTCDSGVDLLFLDLNLGGRSGFQLLDEAVAARFQTIVVSAYHEQALRAFEYGVTDFVAKPFSEERLRKALDRALGRDHSARGAARCLTVRKGTEVRAISIGRIRFIRGADDFSELHLDDGATHLHQKSLTSLETFLPASFVRVHRSFIVNLAYVRGTRVSRIVMTDGSLLPIGRTYREALHQKLGV